jgi:NADH-quinone oxidoreductase subunit G
MGKTVALNTLAEVRARMAEIAPHLEQVDAIVPAEWQSFGRAGKLHAEPFASPILDFYRTDPISRASLVMAECSALHAPTEQATGTHG